jgi:hypothetical protein
VIEISDKPGEEEAEPAFKVNDLLFMQAHEHTQLSFVNMDVLA